jgi:Ca-activated chloride channel family protein
MTSAKYYRADSSDTLNKIYDDIDRLEKTDVEVKKYTQFQELFPWAIISGTAVLLLEVILNQTLWRRLP